MNAQEAYLLARAYTNKAIEGAGALKGAPCQIKSITTITGGHRVTFEWEDGEGETSTETMDVMDGTNGTNGTDGDDGVGISSITYKEEDVSGNYVYTVALTDGNSYDITCPKGPQGATGQTGQTGATGNGIVSIEKTGTSGLVDTYTITYTNGTTSTFTVTNGATPTIDSVLSGTSTNPVQNKVVKEALDGKQDTLTFDNVPTENSTNPVKSGGVYSALAGKEAAFVKGDYLKLTGGTLSVHKSKGDDVYDYKFITTSTADVQPSVKIQRYINGVFQNETNYINDYVRDNPVTLDDLLTFTYGIGGYYWQYTLLENSNQHNKDEVVRWYYTTAVDYEETFDVPQADTSKNLVLQEDLVNAMADKTDTDMVAADFSSAASYTAGNYCVQDGKLYKFKANHSGAWSASDVDEVKITGELSALKSGLTNDDIQTLTAGTDITIVEGGYCVVGNMVVVNVRINVTSTSSGGDVVVTGLPAPKSDGNNVVPVLVSNTSGHVNALVTTTGGIQVNDALTSGIKFLHAVYIK